MTRAAFQTRWVLGLLLLGLAMHPAGAGNKQPPRVVFEPATDSPGAPAIHEGAWIEETPGHALLLQQLGDAERAAYIERTAGLVIDPLGARPDRADRFLTFLFVMENRGETDLQFNPVHSMLATNRKDFHAPLGLADLRYEFRSVGSEMPAAYEKALQVVFDAPVTVTPGQAVSGLLVFRAVAPRVKSYAVTVKYTGPTGDSVSFMAPYVRVKPEKTAKR